MRRQMMLPLIGFVLAALLAGCTGFGSSPAPALLKVDPAGTLDFGEDRVELHVFIDNGGGRTLEWSAEIVGGDSWLTLVGPASGRDKATLTLRADRSGLEPGSRHEAQLRIESNGGNATRSVVLRVSEADEPVPPPALPKVLDLSVTGFTTPKGLLGSSWAMGEGWSATALLAMARDLDEALGRGSLAGFGLDTPSMGGTARTASPLSPGYEAFFVLAWQPVAGADGYELFTPTENGGWTSAGAVDARALEFDDATGHLVHTVRGPFDAGDIGTFRVRAVNAAGPGDASDPDTGVILAEAGLIAPADDTTAPTKPTFEWRPHAEARAYAVYVAQGSLTNHVWHQVVGKDEGTSLTYPGDNTSPDSSLASGEYMWFISAIGPEMNGKTGGYAVSSDWAFRVEN